LHVRGSAGRHCKWLLLNVSRQRRHISAYTVGQEDWCCFRRVTVDGFSVKIFFWNENVHALIFCINGMGYVHKISVCSVSDCFAVDCVTFRCVICGVKIQVVSFLCGCLCRQQNSDCCNEYKDFLHGVAKLQKIFSLLWHNFANLIEYQLFPMSRYPRFGHSE
jgi:hypothetical protein